MICLKKLLKIILILVLLLGLLTLINNNINDSPTPDKGGDDIVINDDISSINLNIDKIIF